MVVRRLNTGILYRVKAHKCNKFTLKCYKFESLYFMAG